MIRLGCGTPPLRTHLTQPLEPQHTGDQPTDIGMFGGAIADAAERAMRAGRAPLMVGGNCVHLTGPLAALQRVHSRVGMAFVDAHGDINTPYTTTSGRYGGMPVATALGLAFPTWREASGALALPADRVFILDARDLDPGEVNTILTANVTVAVADGFPARPGFATERPLRDAVAELAAATDAIYLHIDGDVMDKSLVPHHILAEPGPDLAQMRAAIDTIMATGKVAATALTSICCSTVDDIDPRSGASVLRDLMNGWKAYGVPLPRQDH